MEARQAFLTPLRSQKWRSPARRQSWRFTGTEHHLVKREAAIAAHETEFGDVAVEVA